MNYCILLLFIASSALVNSQRCTEKCFCDTRSRRLHVSCRRLVDADLKDIVAAVKEDFHSLYIEDSEFVHFDAAILKPMKNLNSLWVTKSKLGRISTKAFEQLPHLRNLAFSNSNLNKIDEYFAANSSVIELYLSGNQIESIHENAFSGLNNLVRLDLTDNQLKSLPNGLFSYQNGLHSLKQLFLQRNQLSQIDTIFAGNSTMVHLSLAENKIASLHENSFFGLSKLEWLDLRSNQLTALPRNVFSIQKGLRSLKKVNLVANEFSEINANFISGSTLEELKLSLNRISRVHQDAFSGLNNLTIISFQRNHLESLPRNLFSLHKGLKEVDLSFNWFTEIHANFLTSQSLVYLSLEDNVISRIDANAFPVEANPLLADLSLAFNQIESIPKKVFENAYDSFNLSENPVVCGEEKSSFRLLPFVVAYCF